VTTNKRASSLPSSSPSRNADNFFVLRIDGEYDQLLENTRKTEIAICLNQVSTSRGRTVKIDFSNEYESGNHPARKGTCPRQTCSHTTDIALGVLISTFLGSRTRSRAKSRDG